MSSYLLTKSLDFISQFPQELTSLKLLQQAHETLSQTYRQKKGTSDLTTEAQIKAYFTARMPATFASIYKCLSELDLKNPPETMLDLGAGPGTATLAALEKWPLIKSATLIEQHRLMFKLSQKLFSFLNLSTSINYLQADLTKIALEEKFDLVILGYVLGELSKEEQFTVVEKAWRATSKFFLIVAPGTPFDYEILMRIRDFLTSKGAFILAPCPHSKDCPLKNTKDWCHFSVRLERTKEHQQTKKGTMTFEDEKYSYLLFSKDPMESSFSRIIKKPIQRSGHVIMDLCTIEGIKRQTISRKDKTVYKMALKKEWGENWANFITPKG